VAVNKAQLVEEVARRTGSSPAEARKNVDAVLDAIVTGVVEGDRVALLGFGTFEGTSRPARTARNPRTGDAIDVPAATVPRFRVGTAFKTRVAGGNGAASSTSSTRTRSAGSRAKATAGTTADAPPARKTTTRSATAAGTESGTKSSTTTSAKKSADKKSSSKKSADKKSSSKKSDKKSGKKASGKGKKSKKK